MPAGTLSFRCRASVLAIMVCLTGCGPHFNRFAQPDTYVEPAPKVAVDVPVKPPQKITLSLPNWPYVAYSNAATEAFVLLVVKDPQSFPIPREITFNKADGTSIVMPLLQPDTKSK